MLLFGLLVWEYRSMQWHIDKMRVLQEQYYEYIDAVKRVLKKHTPVPEMSTESSEDEFEVDSFMVINRSPSYLKNATFSHLKTEQLDSLLPRISPYEWDDYTDRVIMGVHQSESKGEPKKKSKTVQASSRSGWKAKKPRKKTVTGIMFALPIDPSRFWVSSFFGPRKKPNGQWGFHHGLDLAAHRGTPAKTIAAGKVEQAEYVSGYGNTVLIGHDKVYKSRYAHLDSISVRKGEELKQGSCVGKVGDTGFTLKAGKDASHLHLELYENGKQVNPLYLLPM